MRNFCSPPRSPSVWWDPNARGYQFPKRGIRQARTHSRIQYGDAAGPADGRRSDRALLFHQHVRAVELLQLTDRRDEHPARKERKSFFGSLSNSAVRTYMSNTATLKSQVGKEIKKQRELTNSPRRTRKTRRASSRSFELGSQRHRRRHDPVFSRLCSDGKLPLGPTDSHGVSHISCRCRPRWSIASRTS